ncbi:MAG TPA: vWA domain-containing protein [Polyangiaceae bacterium]|nr:vWA domain-containing protein [Polyangiaceae bacterium]
MQKSPPRRYLGFSLIAACCTVLAGSCSKDDSAPLPSLPSGGSAGTSSAGGSGAHDAGNSDLGGGGQAGGNGAPSSGGVSSGGANAGGDGAGEGGSSTEPPLGGSAGETRNPQGGGAGFPDIDFNVGGSSEPPLTPDDACVQSRVHTEPIPLDVYIMLDRSGSMNLPQAMPIGNTTAGGGDCNVGDTKESRWCNAINALNAFFISPDVQGTRVALQFFPAGTCQSSSNPLVYGCCSSGQCCLGAAEATPDVKLGALPAQAEPLRAALNAQVPWADRTPIEAALRGLLKYTSTQITPGRQVLNMLITDGGPEGCDSNQNSLARLVASYGLPTYVIGTQGAAYSWLEPIAVAGGAPAHTKHCAGGVSPCHFYDVGSAKADVFVEVLKQIRRSAIACHFAVPPSDVGLVDPTRVKLSFTPANATSATTLKRVDGASACGTGGGFYYDKPLDPSFISLCPSSCDAVRAADGGDMELLVGCLGS